MPVLVFGKVEYVFNDIERFIFCSAFVACKDLDIDIGFNYVKDDLVNFLNLQGDATKLNRRLRVAFHPDKLALFKALRGGGLVFNRLMQNQFISEFVANRTQGYRDNHYHTQDPNFIISNAIASCFNTLVDERDRGQRDDILNNFFIEFYAPEKHDELAEFVEKLYDPDNIKYLTRKILDKVKKEKDFIFDDINLDEKYLSDGKELCSLISYLEAQKNSQAFLCCALLLSNQIPCYNEDMDGNKQAEQEYYIKRYSDAISFYLLAAKDPELLPIVKTMLSFMRADIENSELNDRDNLFFNHLKRVCLHLEARPVLLSGYELFRDTSRIDAPMHLMKKTLHDKSIYVSKDLLEDRAIFGRLNHRKLY